MLGEPAAEPLVLRATEGLDAQPGKDQVEGQAGLQGEVLLDPEGAVMGVSASVRARLDLPALSALFRRVSALLSSRRGASLRIRCQDHEVRFVRLEGASDALGIGRVHYLARVFPVRHIAWGQALSPRQREVSEYAAAGATTKEIARALRCSDETVRSHLDAAYRRLGVCSRVELTQLVFAGG